MPNQWFNFKQFKVWQKESAFKVGTDGVLLGAWCDVKDNSRILDVGTGTGLIALMTAQRSDADIVAIEPDKSSAAEASLNIAKSPWNKRIMILETTLQDYSDNTDLSFDHIVSNPPYFSDSLQNADMRLSRARHNFSLDSVDLLKCAVKLLDDSGMLSVILPYTEANLLIAEACDYGLYCSRMLNVKPLPDKPVKRILLEFTREKKDLSSGFLIIETGKRHNYSHEYRSLTKDFYLDF